MTTLDNDDAPLTLTMNNDQGQTHPEETTLVEQTNNSWHIDSSTGGFDNDINSMQSWSTVTLTMMIKLTWTGTGRTILLSRDP